MKHKKKRWGGIMLLAAVLALMLSMGSVYAADEYVPVQGSADSVKIAKTLDLKGSTSGPEHTATFNTVYVSSDPAGQTPEGKVEPVVLSFSGAEDEKEEFIDFSTVSFNKPGIYRYKVTETIAPSGLGIRPISGSEQNYYVDVVVDNVNTGAGTSGLEVKRYALYKSNGTAKAESLLFENEWDNYRVYVKKDVKGNRGDKTKVFNVNLRFSGFTGRKALTVRWASGTPAANTESQKVTAANPVTVTLNSSSGTSSNDLKLYLKDSDAVLIEGMTNEMTVRAYEAGAYPEYAVKINDSITDTEAKSDSPSAQTPGRNVTVVNDKTYTVTNTKEGDIPTGIFINNWPYILSVLAVLAGCIVFVRRRKARYEYEEDL